MVKALTHRFVLILLLSIKYILFYSSVGVIWVGWPVLGGEVVLGRGRFLSSMIHLDSVRVTGKYILQTKNIGLMHGLCNC